MCGITAAILLDRGAATRVHRCRGRPNIIQEVNDSLSHLRHRGPDCHDHWISEDGRVALGHARLSIKDLSSKATQPLTNGDGTVHVIVNGEFYNYDKLYAELSDKGSGSYHFKTFSDSELLLALYERDGFDCLRSLHGEFAFVLYDSSNQTIFAARDRFGVKPLFWTIEDDRLLIASEAKAFLGYGWNAEWDVRSIVEDGWLHDERTLFKGVRKIQPGHYMTCLGFDYISLEPYWQVEFPDKKRQEPRSEEQMILELRRHLYQAVLTRTQADVPIGVYLSGGLDSAVIAGILADIIKTRTVESPPPSPGGHAVPPFTCFSVGFQANTEFDEMPIAQRTAEHLGVPLVAQRLDEATLAENFEAATLGAEHHNPDLNSVAKFKLSELTANAGIRVILSGEGSDEHFGGYSQYVADSVREPDYALGDDILTEDARRALTSRLETATTAGYKGLSVGTGSEKARHMLNNTYISTCLWTVTVAPFAAWTSQLGTRSVQETRAASVGARVLSLINSTWHPLHTAQYVWTKSILSNLILTCMGDRMEMAHSVEGRPPFLDHELAYFANHLPPSTKLRVDSRTGEVTEKWILREAAKPFITQEIYERKKHPFTAPNVYKVGGPLYQLMSRLMIRENIEHLGFVDVQEASTFVDRAFRLNDQVAMRACLNIAGWIVLSREFRIPQARSDCVAAHSESIDATETVHRGWLWTTLQAVVDRALTAARYMY